MSRDSYETPNPRFTAYHEAGHAVLHVYLALGCEQVTIIPNYENGEAGFAKHQGEFPKDEDAESLRLYAEDAFWLRHAIAMYAGAEASRRAGKEDWRAGADNDYYNAEDAINQITDDEESIRCLYNLAMRRAVVLVEHYWPEIEALATALLKSRTLTGNEVRCIVNDSLMARHGGILSW
jgi:ATP-dependent Zn protease